MDLENFYRYVPPVDEDLDKSFYVADGGRTLIPPHTPYPPARHPDAYHFTWKKGRILDEHQIVYITRGKGLFESVGCAPVPIEAGDVFILFPSIWHRYEPDPETGWDEHYVGLRGQEASRALADFGLSSDQPVRHVGVHSELIETFNRIVEELRWQRVGYGRMLAGHAYHLLAQVVTLVRRQSFADTKVERTIRRACAIMHEQTGRRIDMEQLAGELAVGYSWFRRAFREYAGVSPGQYHLQLRLSRARHMLQYTSIPVGQIAAETGFDTPAYFARVFGKKTGQTPRQFRSARKQD
ncbi:MAG: AraC family transcriptional regulator [bacterium]|nr:AraC family transcriptional regulator [bacterium]